jgi:hypothetical protein
MAPGPSFFTSTSFALNIIEQTIAEADGVYDRLKLEEWGLNKEAFRYAYRGYKKLLKKGWINNSDIITICDFSQSSKKKRLYLLDLKKYKVLLNTYVAHGRNSGSEFANKFSNSPGSLQSSLGFYVTRNTYTGGHGMSLTLRGLEKGINDNAERRRIVVHGSRYVGDDYFRFRNYMGRSFGCPAVPDEVAEKIIHKIKNGSCLFIYHPDKYYLNGSNILNG